MSHLKKTKNRKEIIQSGLILFATLLSLFLVLPSISAAPYKTFSWQIYCGDAARDNYNIACDESCGTCFLTADGYHFWRKSELKEIGYYYFDLTGKRIEVSYAQGTNICKYGDPPTSGTGTIASGITIAGQYTKWNWNGLYTLYTDPLLNTRAGGVAPNVCSRGNGRTDYYWDDTGSGSAHDDGRIVFTTQDVVCTENADCNDNNVRTEDVCTNPNTPSASCQHNNVRCNQNSDCGADGFTGNAFCQSGDVYQTFNTFICSNPGTTQSSCSNLANPKVKTDCSSTQVCSNGACTTKQCSDGVDNDGDNLIDSQDSGCWDNIDDPNTYNPVLNNESRATIACFTNAQCGRDGFIGNKVCQGDDLYQDYRSFTCNKPGKGSGSCTQTTIKKLVEDCPKTCANAQCANVACYGNSDCNDGDLYTFDECSSPGTALSSCSHSLIRCVTDNDCGNTGFTGNEFCQTNDVFKQFQTAKCISPGTKSSKCEITLTPTFLIDCGETSYGNWVDSYCKNNNVYRSRTVNNKGCASGYCFSNFSNEETLVETCSHGCQNGRCSVPPQCTINSDCPSGKICVNNVCIQTQTSCSYNSDCGVSGFLNQKFCKDNNVFDKYVTYTCNNPGTSQSLCTSSTEEKKVSDCNNGCANGQCIITQCTYDDDCKKDYYSKAYCTGNKVYKDFHDFSCVNNGCVDNVTKKLVQECDDTQTCKKGKCIDQIEKGTVIFEENPDSALLILPQKEETKDITLSYYNENLSQGVKTLGKKEVIVSSGINWMDLGWLWWVLIIIAVIVIVLIIIYLVM